MENKIFIEATILFLPPIFSQIELNKKNTVFLYLNEISKSNILFSELQSDDKKDLCSFTRNINKRDFGTEILDLVPERIKQLKENFESDQELLNNIEIVFVNYPINIKQFDILEEKLQSLDIKIEKMIISKFPSFDVLLSSKSKYFLCPVCFKSYDRESNLTENEYICPFDGEKFSVSQINKFIDFFTEYYLQNSLEVIQKFGGEEQNKKKMFPLNINDERDIEENLKSDLLKILKKS
jgi:adenylate kinase family enzyme